MKKKFLKKQLSIFVLLFVFTITFSHSQTDKLETSEITKIAEMQSNDDENPCITELQYKFIEKECNKNSSLINNMEHRGILTPALSWPLRLANGLNDCSYYVITNNVDDDNTSGFKDYNCGTRTYNGHRGTDIVPYPYTIYKMENNQVEVIAAAPGTIVVKSDGNFDKNCVTGASPSEGNYIVIQHSDGSRTLYYHMKKNSLTSKTIGQNVVTGEFLGTVGSSGSSNIPHLHFEVWSGSSASTIKDPFAGTCNTSQVTSLWENQKPYKEHALLKIQINTIAPVLTSCPTTETPNEMDSFAPGGTARFYRWIREDEVNMTTNMRIINPDGTNFDNWTGIGNTTFNAALYNSTRTLPSTPGIYTYEASFNGNTCSKTFTIQPALSNTQLNHDANFEVYPNPSNGKIFLVMNSLISGKVTIQFFNSISQNVKSFEINSQKEEMELGLSSGIYFYKVIYENDILIKTGKVIIQ